MSGLFDDLLEDAPAPGLFDDLLAEEPAPVARPRRGGTRAEIQRGVDDAAQIQARADFAANDPRRVDKPLPGGPPSVLDKPMASPTQDPMLRPEFVDEVRARFANVPPEMRLPALREYAKTNDVNGRAARQILAEVEAENKAVRNTEERSGALVDFVQKAGPGKGGTGKPTGQLPFPETNEVMQAAKGETARDQVARDSAARKTLAMESGVDAIAARAELQSRDFDAEAFAEQNPVLGALGSGAARQWRGAVNIVPTVMDFAARLAGVDTSGFNSESEYSAELKRQADSLMPKVGRQEMGKAWDKGEFGGWLMTNLVAQAPQIAQSVAAAFIPGAAPMALAAMGAQAAGSKFADTRDSAAAATSGLIEAGSEMLPLAAFKRSYEALSKLPPVARGEVLRAIGRALPQVGQAVTSQAVTGAIEEVVAEIGNNAIDMVRGENKSLLDGVASAAVIGAFASGAMSLPQAAGALGRAAESGDAQFARAFEQDVGDTYFKAQPVQGYAARAGNAQFYDPSFVDPSQTARPAGPASPAAPAGAPAGSSEGSPGAPQAAGSTPSSTGQGTTRVAPDLDAMPSEPLSGDQVSALVAAAARDKAASQGVASDIAAAEPRGDEAIGIARKAPGSLVAAADQVLKANAQAAAAENGDADVSPTVAPGPMAEPGGPAGRGDAVGGVDGAGPAAGQPGRAGADAVQPVGRDGAPAPARDRTAAEGALNATTQTTRVPERAAGGDGRVVGSDADIRREYSARYERSRATAATTAKRLRDEAAGLRRAGTPELIKRADQLDKQAQTWEQHADDQPVLSMPPKAAAASFSRLQGAINDTFGRRVVAYYDARETAADGFAENGVAFVNLAKPDRSVAFTAFHELQHLVRKEAEAGDSAAQAATQMLDQVWGMIDPNAKRQYAERYLFRNAIEAGAMTPEQALEDPKLRDEMLSDFMGKRATDEGFMRRLAQKNPTQFRSFAERWIGAIGRLLDALKGRRQKDDRLDVGGLKDLDRAIVNLERAKLVAEKVLQAWADAKPQQAEPSLTAQISRRESAREGGDSAVVAEVAPNPDKPEAGSWKKLDQGQREYVTKEVMDTIWPQLMREIGWPKATYTFGSGTFEGEVNPNVLVSMPGASFAELSEMAHLLGYVLDQKAMVVFDEADTTGGSQAGFVKVIPPASMSTQQVESLRQAIAQAVPQATGDTVRDGGIIYGNFSDLSDQAFSDAIAAAVEAMPAEFSGVDVRDMGRFRSEYIQPDTRDGYLEGTRYGQGGQEQGGAGRDDVRRRGGSDLGRIKAIGERALKLRDSRVAYSRAGGAGGAGSLRPVKPEGIRDRPRLSFGDARPDAVEVDAWHYSQAPRSTLSTAAYGTGLRGSGADKFKASADPRLRQRAYFYANKGQGIHPEAGVGGYAHRVLLRNIYDQDSDPLKLLRGNDREAFEAGVLDAGFDGYLYRAHNLSAAVVVLGQKAVPVELAGQYGAIDAGMEVPPATKRSNSAREDKGGDLGAFDPFANLDDVETIEMDSALDVEGDARPMTQQEMDDLNAQLQEEQGWAETERAVYDYQAPSDDSLAAVGIMAEAAYQPLPYRRDGSTVLRFTSVGAQYEFRLRTSSEGTSAMTPDTSPGPGAAMALRYVSEQTAEAYNRRVAASIDLTRRGFDLYTAVPSAARTRVQSAWQDVSNLRGAFEFKKVDPMAYKGRPPVEMLNAIARDMMAGSKFTMTAEKGGRAGWYTVYITEDGKPTVEAEIEYSGGADPRLTMHTIGLNKGTGAGKAFYQVAFAWGHALGIKTNADRHGLTSVNTYRRTEQMMAAAARAGEAGAVNPGAGQRVYGWNNRPKDAAQKARNLVRLALASARNAAEMVPGVRDLAYDLASDTFSWRRGPEKGASADAFVTEALKDKDVRALSVSRSTLARAAVTFSAIDGQLKLDPDTVVKSPILYSSRGDSGEYADIGDPLSGDYKQLDGRMVSFNLVLQDSGQEATFTIDAARAMRNLDDRLETARQLAKCIG